MSVAESVSEAVSVPTEIKLGECSYSLSPLTVHDFALIEASTRNERLEALLQQTRIVKGVNLPDAVKGKAIAEIMSTPVSLVDVLPTFSGQEQLLFHSMKKTRPDLTLDMMKTIPPMDIAVLSKIVAEITGLKVEEETEDSPLGMTERIPTHATSVPTFVSGNATLQE